jgi:LAS superfamily LD-carboxypeptidase LdcB
MYSVSIVKKAIKVMLKTKKDSNKKTIVILLAVISGIILLALLIMYLTRSLFFALPAPADQTQIATSEQEQVSKDVQQKQNNIEVVAKNQPTDSTPSTTTKSLILTESDVNTDAKQVEVRAYLTDISENGGTCQVTFTKDGQASIVTKSTAFADVSTTQCGANDTPVSKFGTSGIWKLSVVYSSSTTTAQATGTVSI